MKQIVVIFEALRRHKNFNFIIEANKLQSNIHLFLEITLLNQKGVVQRLTDFRILFTRTSTRLADEFLEHKQNLGICQALKIISIFI